MKKLNSLIYLLSLIFVFTFITSCSSIEKIDSKYAKTQIIIDGADNDWQESFYYFPESKVILGFRNDENFLYVCLKSSDSEVFHKIMMNGLTIWINDKENDSKTFGIHYPIGALNEFGNIEKPKNDEERDNVINKKYDNMLYSMDLLYNEGVDKESISVLNVVRKYNLTAIMKRDNGTIVYELAIPLKSDKMKLDIRSSKNKIITLGFGTGEMKRNNQMKPNNSDLGESAMPGAGNIGMNSGMPGMGGAGMPGGGRGMGGRGRGGNFGSNTNKTIKPLNSWFDIKLAEK